MAYKTDKLQSRIVEKFGSQAAFADAIGMDKSTLFKLLKEGREWKGSKLMQAIKLLSIPKSEIDSYFFEEIVEETQQKEV